MILTDKLTIDAPKRTKEGYMAVHARAARAGIYDYMGYEVDPEGKTFNANDVVKVYRPPEVVFDAANMRSFVMRPITNDHPSEAVTADNWTDLAKGVIVGAVKDGDYLGFDLAFFDADTIRDIDSGKRELSNGYQADLVFGDGVTPSGEAYHAIQTSQTGNHVALVGKGRAGSACAIGVCDAMSETTINSFLVNLGDADMTTKPVKITIDGASHTVELSDAAAILVGQMQTALDRQATELATAQTSVGTLTAHQEQVQFADDLFRGLEADAGSIDPVAGAGRTGGGRQGRGDAGTIDQAGPAGMTAADHGGIGSEDIGSLARGSSLAGSQRITGELSLADFLNVVAVADRVHGEIHADRDQLHIGQRHVLGIAGLPLSSAVHVAKLEINAGSPLGVVGVDWHQAGVVDDIVFLLERAGGQDMRLLTEERKALRVGNHLVGHFKFPR